jgi:DnaJ-class molecular chaperone
MSSHSTGVCTECKGRGWLDVACSRAEEARICGLCHGTGATTTGKECSGCRGSGQIDVRLMEQRKCWRCSGTGKYPPPEDL